MISSQLESFGSDIDSDEVARLVSKTDMKDLADYYVKATTPGDTPTETKINQMQALSTILDKFSQIEGIDGKLKGKLENLSDSIDVYVEYLKD